VPGRCASALQRRGTARTARAHCVQEQLPDCCGARFVRRWLRVPRLHARSRFRCRRVVSGRTVAAGAARLRLGVPQSLRWLRAVVAWRARRRPRQPRLAGRAGVALARAAHSDSGRLGPPQGVLEHVGPGDERADQRCASATLPRSAS
jgi:hypothetical protein